MNKRKFLLLLLILTLILTACNTNKSSEALGLNAVSEETVQFHFIDVGQGDCTFIQNGDTTILIDAGPQKSGHIVYNYLKKLGIKYLDYFIGTHPHEDHIGGAFSVLTGIDVGCVFLNGDGDEGFHFENLVDLLIEKNITPEIPDTDCIYQIGGLRLKFLSPTQTYEDTNYNSLVVRVDFKNVSALFTGDIEKPVESDLLSKDINLSADILKVAHHGSRNSSSIEFLYAVSPAVAVIQCGKGNSYGHPHSEALDRLTKTGTQILRCDKEGTIIIATDGETVCRSTGEKYIKPDNSKKQFIYIGNKKSMVVHSDTCPNLPAENNRIEFNTLKDAINEGYKKCGNCNP